MSSVKRPRILMSCAVLLVAAAAVRPGAAGEPDTWVFAGPTVVVQGEVAGSKGGDRVYVLLVAQPSPRGFGMLETMSTWCPAQTECELRRDVVPGTIDTAALGGTTIKVYAQMPGFGVVDLDGVRTAHDVPLTNCPTGDHTVTIASVAGDDEVEWSGRIGGRAWLYGSCDFYMTFGVVSVRV